MDFVEDKPFAPSAGRWRIRQQHQCPTLCRTDGNAPIRDIAAGITCHIGCTDCALLVIIISVGCKVFCSVIHNLQSPQNMGTVVRAYVVFGGAPVVFVGHRRPWEFKKRTQVFSRKLERHCELVFLDDYDAFFRRAYDEFYAYPERTPNTATVFFLTEIDFKKGDPGAFRRGEAEPLCISEEVSPIFVQTFTSTISDDRNGSERATKGACYSSLRKSLYPHTRRGGF